MGFFRRKRQNMNYRTEIIQESDEFQVQERKDEILEHLIVEFNGRFLVWGYILEGISGKFLSGTFKDRRQEKKLRALIRILEKLKDLEPEVLQVLEQDLDENIDALASGVGEDELG